METFVIIFVIKDLLNFKCMIIIVHTLFSVTALVAGAYIFFIQKGTSLHKSLGYIYSTSMVALIVTSFWIFELWGGFGVYHAMSMVSFITLCIGLYFPLFRRDLEHWYVHHYIWMGYSYIGLVMAGGSHCFKYFSDYPSWLLMIAFWGLPYGIGSYLIFSNKKKITDNPYYKSS